MSKPSKPPYRIPSMKKVETIEPNGLKVVSTFSGCGGSCLGFRMAGFEVMWASEFVPAARDVYKLNHPNSILCPDDIRKVKATQILKACGIKKGELDVFEGSPPCSSFSSSGSREEGWGVVKKYSDTKQRTDDLFFEWARILNGLMPKVFVAENVPGLTTGKAKGTFIEIMGALRSIGYRVRAKILDAQWLGVPQVRKRLIIVGVRDDLDLEPAFPKPLPYRYSIRDALPWLAADTKSAETFSTGSLKGNKIKLSKKAIRDTDFRKFAIMKEWAKIKPGETSDRYQNLARPNPDRPSPTITQAAGSHPGTAGVTHPFQPRKFTIPELRRICGFPDDFQLTGSFLRQWERLGRAVPPVMMRAVASAVRDEILLPARER